MRHRYTINELENTKSREYLDDRKLIIGLITERQSTCNNPFAPLYKRLEELRRNLEKETIVLYHTF